MRTFSTNTEDNGLHLGLNGTWPASGAKMQWTRKNQWTWDSRQRTKKIHTGVFGQIWIEIPRPGLHQIHFAMREDGFEFDKFILTNMKYPGTFSLLAAGLLTPSLARDQKKKQMKPGDLVGLYEIVSGQEGPKKIPGERLKGKVSWTKKTITGYDRNENTLYAATYQLNTSEKPWKITMKGTMLPAGKDQQPRVFERKGLIKMKGKLLTLIYSPKSGEPDDFKIDGGEHKFTFRKTNKSKDS